MTRWEYTTAVERIGGGWYLAGVEQGRKLRNPGSYDLAGLLNDLGEDGWELIATTGGDHLVFKRLSLCTVAVVDDAAPLAELVL